MKIGFDAKRLFNNFTGLGNYSRTLVSQLAEQFPEHDYLLYTPKVIVNSETQQFSEDLSFEIKGPKKKLPLWREVRSLKMMKEDRLDIYHGLSHELPLGIQKTSIKSVVTIHDLIFKVYPKTYKPFDRIIYDNKFKYACQKSNRIVAISKSTKKDIIDFYGIPEDKVEVIYQACNPLYLELQSREEVEKVRVKYRLPEKYLLYVGSVIERKGLLKVVQALDLIKEEDKLPLVIIGEGGAYAEKVRRYASQKGQEKWLIWTSVSDNTELQALYQGAQIFIYPSIYEGFGIPVVEALLSNTPVITSNVSSLPEAAGPNSICINPTSESEIAEGILRILGDTVLQEKMRTEGRVYAEETFNKKVLGSKMMNLYSRLLS